MADIMKHLGMVLLFFMLLAMPILIGCGDDDDDDDSGGPPADDDTEDDDDTTDDDVTDDDDSVCDGCLIDDVCYPDGVPNPANSCQVCDTAAADDGWSDNDGAACDDGEYCNGADACDGGNCAEHAGDPCDDQCQACNEGTDACDNTEGACDDGIFCNGADTCESGACGVHAGDPCNIDEFCEEPDTCTPGCFEDTDRDGYGDGESYQERDGDCPYGWVADKTDCDPEIFLTNPGAFDLPDDGIDQNCDGFEFKATEAVGIFVDGSVDGVPTCAGTMADPCGSINEGIYVAEQASKTNVFVAEGTYDEAVYTTTVSLFGGYDGSDWSRDIEANETVVAAPSIYAITISSMDDAPLYPVVVEGFTIHGSDDLSSYGVIIQYSLAQLIGNDIDGGTGGFSYGTVGMLDRTLLAYNDISGGTASYISNGAYSFYSTDFLVGNTIHGGTSNYYTYGLWNVGGHLTLIDNSIDGGSCPPVDISCVRSAGVLDLFGYTTLEDNTISGGSNSFVNGVDSLLGHTRLIGNTIDGGLASQFSVGVSLRYGEGYARGNTITGNIESDKKGKYAFHSYGVLAQGGANSTLIGNTIDGGTESMFTKGVVFDGGTHTVQGNQIDGGESSFLSWGLSIGDAADSTIINNGISGGTSYYSYGLSISAGTHDVIHNTVDGGKDWAYNYNTTGMLIMNSADVDLINNIIGGGDGSFWSEALDIDMDLIKATTVDLYGNDLWNGADCLLSYDDGSFNCLDLITEVNGLAWAGDNVSADPVFDTDNFHLTSGSTAVIDQGVDYSSYYSGDLADTDYDGEVRPNGSDPDIGADEYYAISN